MLKEELRNIITDLNKHKHNTDDVFPAFVQERLDRSLIMYYKTLIDSANALRYRLDTLQVMKKLLKDN